MNDIKGVIEDQTLEIKVTITETGPKGEPGEDAKPIIKWSDLGKGIENQ